MEPSSALVLAPPNFIFPFKLEVNISRFIVGFILMQNQSTIFKQTLSLHNQLKTIYKNELMTIILIKLNGGTTSSDKGLSSSLINVA